ncbi:MAG: cupin domain-containing protein [bacterium]|jgi:quercetin dioxygenase-like cupin family protein
MDYRFFADLAAEVNIPADGILSRVLYNDDSVRVVIFGFAPGQELTEHTSKFPALLHVLTGDVKLRLGTDDIEAHAGTWVRMAPNLAHGLLARTPATVLLTLIKTQA